MKTFEVTFNVPAESKEEAAEKLEAFNELCQVLDHEDFMDAAEIIVNDPSIAEFIREVSPGEGEKLTLVQMISIAKKAYKKFG